MNKLSTFSIKLIAVITMTIDHLAGIGWRIPLFDTYGRQMRLIGRIAAPLFLFCLVQGAAHTKNRRKMIVRIYLMGLCTGVMDAMVNFLWGDSIGVHSYGNILFDFFYVVLLIELLEQLRETAKTRSRKALLIILAGAAFIAAPILLYQALDKLPMDSLSMEMRFFVHDLMAGCLPVYLNYGWPFVILGVLMYVARTKNKQCLTYLAFCLLCFAGHFAVRWGFRQLWYIPYGTMYTDLNQCMMILALPVMALYNGQRGRAVKWPFYWYYPFHRHAIAAVTALLMGSPYA